MVYHTENEVAAVTLSPYEREAREHGVYMAREVIQILETAGYLCCVTGIKALAYYGAPRPANVSRHPSRIFLYADQGPGVAHLRA